MNIFKSLVCLLMGLAASAHADEWNLDQLMRILAQTKVGHASFVEKKSIAMLDKPIESSGELFYTAPDRLEKRTLKPRPESMVLNRGTLTVEQKGRKHVLPLQNYPEVAAFIDSIRGTLAGDKSALERTYQLNLTGDQHAWTLLLTPIDAKMQKIVEKIRIAGIGNELRSIEIKQADGDSSLMTITQLSTP